MCCSDTDFHPPSVATCVISILDFHVVFFCVFPALNLFRLSLQATVTQHFADQRPIFLLVFLCSRVFLSCSLHVPKQAARVTQALCCSEPILPRVLVCRKFLCATFLSLRDVSLSASCPLPLRTPFLLFCFPVRGFSARNYGSLLPFQIISCLGCFPALWSRFWLRILFPGFQLVFFSLRLVRFDTFILVSYIHDNHQVALCIVN